VKLCDDAVSEYNEADELIVLRPPCLESPNA